MVVIKFDRTSYGQYPDRHKWIEENLGVLEWGWPRDGDLLAFARCDVYTTEAFGNYRYTFKNSKDATFFALVWSNGTRE